MILAAFTATFSAPGCISDDISYSPTDILAFSRDTVNFDTVFTGVGTPTARLVIANRASKGVVISSIRFKNPNSIFSINVDGVSAREFHDVEIRANDSIFSFIECLIPESEGKEPVRVEDELEFVTNGVPQSVLLEAYGQNIVRLQNVTVSDNMHLTAERPYVVFDSLVVAPGATLTIDPDTRLLFHDKGELIVHGKLNAVGAPGKMIQMRGDRLDNILPDVPYDLLAGQWKGVRFAPESFENRLEYVDLRSTVQGVVVDSCGNLDKTKLTIRNSWLHNSQGDVLNAAHSKVEALGVCFSEAAGAVVRLAGGVNNFVQCTFANQYLFAAVSSPLITLSHVLPDPDNPSPAPLMKGNFENSIIYGNSSDINIGDLAKSNVYFRYVSFRAKGENDEHFIECLWNTDPLFATDREKYLFDYRVLEDSPVIHKGNPEYITPSLLFDMTGANRLSSGNPTLGAYASPIPSPSTTP